MDLPARGDPDAQPWLDGVARVDAASWSLACRRTRVLSQRELAAAAGVSHSTIERLEAGEGRPAYDTIARILAGTGYELVAVDSRGGLLDTVEVGDGPRDRIGRRMPVHLNPRRTRSFFGLRPGEGNKEDTCEWWGWYSLAWHDDDPLVPTWTFTRHRPRR